MIQSYLRLSVCAACGSSVVGAARNFDCRVSIVAPLSWPLCDETIHSFGRLSLTHVLTPIKFQPPLRHPCLVAVELAARESPLQHSRMNASILPRGPNQTDELRVGVSRFFNLFVVTDNRCDSTPTCWTRPPSRFIRAPPFPAPNSA